MAALSSLDRKEGGGGRCFQWWVAARVGCSACTAGEPRCERSCKEQLQSCAALVSTPAKYVAPAPCYRGADAKAAAEVVKQLPAMLKLPTGAPVYADGASSGGSIALRLPRLAKLDGVIGGEELGPWRW